MYVFVLLSHSFSRVYRLLGLIRAHNFNVLFCCLLPLFVGMFLLLDSVVKRSWT